MQDYFSGIRFAASKVHHVMVEVINVQMFEQLPLPKSLMLESHSSNIPKGYKTEPVHVLQNMKQSFVIQAVPVIHT